MSERKPVSFDDLPPIEITGGEDAADYVGRHRGGDDAAAVREWHQGFRRGLLYGALGGVATVALTWGAAETIYRRLTGD